VIEAAIVDASVAVKWVVREADSDRARLLSQARLEAPDLLLVECANILWKKVLLRDVTQAEAAARLQWLERAPVSLAESPPLLEAALGLAFDLRHPVYDCVYLALALRRDLPLVTGDERLVTVAGRSPKLSAHVLRLADLPD
jgi:predicted nucleic acid-binding protein